MKLLMKTLPFTRIATFAWMHFEAGPGWGVKMNPEWLKAATYQKSERKA